MATVTPSRPDVFNLPNQLTFARFVLALVLFGLIAMEWWGWCLVVFALALAGEVPERSGAMSVGAALTGPAAHDGHPDPGG